MFIPGIVASMVQPAAGGGGINWTNYTTVGNSLAITTSTNAAIQALDANNVAVHNQNGMGLYTWDGTDWTLVGSHGAPGVGIDPGLAAISSTQIVKVDHNAALGTYTHNGTNWVLSGSALSIPGMGGGRVAALNSTDVAFTDGSIDDLRTYRWGGASWSQIGNSFFLGTNNPGIAALNGTDIAVIDTGGIGGIGTYRFDGTNWSLVGSVLNLSFNTTPDLTALNETDIVIVEPVTDVFMIYRFDGANWSAVTTNDGTTIPGIVSRPQELSALNSTDFAYYDSDAGNLVTYRYSFV